MKLLVIVDSYPPHHTGGYELRCKDVSEELARRGHDLLIITSTQPRNSKRIVQREVNILRILTGKLGFSSIAKKIYHDLRDIKLLAKHFNKYDPDIVYLWHLVNLSTAIIPFFSTKRIPVVYDEGGFGLANFVNFQNRPRYFYDNEKDPAIKKLLKNAIRTIISLLSRGLVRMKWTWPEDIGIIFNSTYTSNYSNDYSVPINNSVVVHSGINLDRFPYRSNRIVATPLKIILPGRIVSQKGTLDSISLGKILKEDDIQFQLIIIGEIISRSYYSEIERKIMEYSLTKEVIYHPMVSQEKLANYYGEADICFFPSHQKYGMSRIPLEAMASGCLVITYGNEGSGEIIKDKDTGYIVPDGDVSLAAKRIRELINNPEDYSRINHNARMKIEHGHSMNRYIDKIEDFLINCLKRSNA